LWALKEVSVKYCVASPDVGNLTGSIYSLDELLIGGAYFGVRLAEVIEIKQFQIYIVVLSLLANIGELFRIELLARIDGHMDFIDLCPEWWQHSGQQDAVGAYLYMLADPRSSDSIDDIEQV